MYLFFFKKLSLLVTEKTQVCLAKLTLRGIYCLYTTKPKFGFNVSEDPLFSRGYVVLLGNVVSFCLHLVCVRAYVCACHGEYRDLT